MEKEGLDIATIVGAFFRMAFQLLFKIPYGTVAIVFKNAVRYSSYCFKNTVRYSSYCLKYGTVQ